MLRSRLLTEASQDGRNCFAPYTVERHAALNSSRAASSPEARDACAACGDRRHKRKLKIKSVKTPAREKELTPHLTWRCLRRIPTGADESSSTSPAIP